MKKAKIKFGYEVDSGKEVFINLRHMVISGLTQEAGKTTAIVGLIKRSGLKALIIKTKIGEKAITEGNIIPPFYKDNFDWEYAVELLESARKEKLKFERSWIIKYSKTAKSLLEFKNNIDVALSSEKMSGLERSVLITLQAYLEKILPELQYAPLSKTLDLSDGINIMDLERFKEETQTLVIRSVLNEILSKEKDTIVIIPEAWRYLPERNNSPVKRPAEAFIRQGATNNNYLWIDSQDITGVSKAILKQVSNWVLGYQREKNEIQRTLDQINLPKKPRTDEVATLKLGQFYVATSDFVVKAYAQPSWVEDSVAKKISLGELSIDSVQQPVSIAPYQVQKYVYPKDPVVESKESSVDYKKIHELRNDFISNRNDFFTKFEQINDSIRNLQSELLRLQNSIPKVDEDELLMRIMQKLPIGQSNNSIDKDVIVREVIARIPKSSGSITYEVAPLEKIKKDFLLEIKNKMILDIQNRSVDAKKVLKYLESTGKKASTSDLCTKLFMYPQSGGGYGKKVLDAVKELESIQVAERDERKSFTSGILMARILFLMENHSASTEEINLLYNHILSSLI